MLVLDPGGSSQPDPASAEQLPACKATGEADPCSYPHTDPSTSVPTLPAAPLTSVLFVRESVTLGLTLWALMSLYWELRFEERA